MFQNGLIFNKGTYICLKLNPIARFATKTYCLIALKQAYAPMNAPAETTASRAYCKMFVHLGAVV